MPSNNKIHRQRMAEAHRGASLLCILLAAAIMTACGSKKEEVRFHRFEQLLFDTPVEELQSTLTAREGEYSTPLLYVAPSDPNYMAMVTDFVTDSTMRYIYRVTDSLYRDLSDVEQELGKALGRAVKLWPSLQRYKDFYTLVTADFDDYQNRVFCDYDGSLAVSIDRYAVGEMQDYQSFGVPMYLQQVLKREYIAPDCMAAIARANIALPDHEPTLLDYTIAEGKTLYFLEQTMPGTPDTIRLRYTKQQMKWVKNNTANVWGWIIQNQMLYSSDYTQLRGIIDEAPKTNAFGEESAPRTTAYIGWQIVRRYMKQNDVSLQELFEETDSQKILTLSGWRP